MFIGVDPHPEILVLNSSAVTCSWYFFVASSSHLHFSGFVRFAGLIIDISDFHCGSKIRSVAPTFRFFGAKSDTESKLRRCISKAERIVIVPITQAFWHISLEVTGCELIIKTCRYQTIKVHRKRLAEFLNHLHQSKTSTYLHKYFLIASPMMRYLAPQIFCFLTPPNSVPDLVYTLQHDNHQDGLENGVKYIFSKDSQILST